LIQAELSKVYYWKPYTLPNAESQKLRDQMRRQRVTEFKVWAPDSNVLDLEARYGGIKTRLEEYVAAQG